jgi:hypothetical protein
MLRLPLVGLISLFLFALPIQAGLITSVGGGTTTPFDLGSTCSSGPSAGVDAGFSVSASGDACYPYGDGWGLGANGYWSISLIGDNSGASMITIDLGGLFTSAGGFVNYSPTFGTALIEALGVDGTTVLESYDIAAVAPISTAFGQDAGAFRGISRPSADIAYLRFGGSYMAMHDITLEDNAVPEPTSVLLIACGLAALGVLRRRASN